MPLAPIVPATILPPLVAARCGPEWATIVATGERELQESVFAFLEHSGPGPAGRPRRIDTHASVVFLGGDRALKIKRAVRLPFLDYSTLESASTACDEELKVNAGNAPELYRRVVAITRADDGGLEIGGSGAPVEWAVEMARFDEEQALDRIAGTRLDRAVSCESLSPMQSCNRTTRRRARTAKPGSPPFPASSTATPQNSVSVHGLDAAAIDQLDVRSHDHVATLQALLEAARRAGVRAALPWRSSSGQYCADERSAAAVRCHRIRSGDRDDGYSLRSRASR